MGGSDQSEAAQSAFTQNSQLSEQTYGLGKGALEGGLSYLQMPIRGAATTRAPSTRPCRARRWTRWPGPTQRPGRRQWPV
jgi:hypothetical protein